MCSNSGVRRLVSTGRVGSYMEHFTTYVFFKQWGVTLGGRGEFYEKKNKTKKTTFAVFGHSNMNSSGFGVDKLKYIPEVVLFFLLFRLSVYLLTM